MFIQKEKQSKSDFFQHLGCDCHKNVRLKKGSGLSLGFLVRFYFNKIGELPISKLITLILLFLCSDILFHFGFQNGLIQKSKRILIILLIGKSNRKLRLSSLRKETLDAFKITPNRACANANNSAIIGCSYG